MATELVTLEDVTYLLHHFALSCCQMCCTSQPPNLAIKMCPLTYLHKCSEGRVSIFVLSFFVKKREQRLLYMMKCKMHTSISTTVKHLLANTELYAIVIKEQL